MTIYKFQKTGLLKRRKIVEQANIFCLRSSCNTGNSRLCTLPCLIVGGGIIWGKGGDFSLNF